MNHFKAFFLLLFFCAQATIAQTIPSIGDVHCFLGGSMVTMSDLSEKKIEYLEPGDKVLSYDFETNKYAESLVAELITATHRALFVIYAGNKSITTTEEHPFWIIDKGWASFLPAKSNQNYVQDVPVKQLVHGDRFLVIDNNRENAMPLDSLGEYEIKSLTYTITLRSGNCFFVNGFLVKTETLILNNVNPYKEFHR